MCAYRIRMLPNRMMTVEKVFEHKNVFPIIIIFVYSIPGVALLQIIFADRIFKTLSRSRSLSLIV